MVPLILILLISVTYSQPCSTIRPSDITFTTSQASDFTFTDRASYDETPKNSPYDSIRSGEPNRVSTAKVNECFKSNGDLIDSIQLDYQFNIGYISGNPINPNYPSFKLKLIRVDNTIEEDIMEIAMTATDVTNYQWNSAAGDLTQTSYSLNLDLADGEYQFVFDFTNGGYNMHLFLGTLSIKINWNTALCGVPLLAWYDGTSVDLNNNIWRDKTNKGNDGTIGGTEGDIFNSVDLTNALYLNNHPIFYGTPQTKVSFTSLPDSHTLINLCKYNGNARGRIIQSSLVNELYGFHDRKSGVAWMDGKWITGEPAFDKFGDDWVLSLQSHDHYRANGRDLTVNPANAVSPGVIKINDGVYPNEKSDFACAEVIAIDGTAVWNNAATIKCFEEYLDDKYGLDLYDPTNTQCTPPNDIDSCLNSGRVISGWYKGDKYDATSGIWYDQTCNFQNAVFRGAGKGQFDGADTTDSRYLNGEPSVYGTPETEVTFGDNKGSNNLDIDGDHTVINLCKYNGINRQRIIQSGKYNTVFGFHGGKSGVAHYAPNKWITAETNKFANEWVLSIQSPDYYRGNGIDWTISNQAPHYDIGLLKINSGSHYLETSDFACAEVIVFNGQILEAGEISCIESYFDNKYNLNINDAPTTGCNTNVIESCGAGPPDGWYDGTSVSIANGLWKDKSCNNQDAIITGSGSALFDGKDSANSLYLNLEPIVYGTTDTVIVFGDDAGSNNLLLSPDNTVFNLCKYNGNAKRRILQSSVSNYLNGFHQGRSGVAHYGQWQTDEIDTFGSDWVLSTQSYDSYRANGKDLTINTYTPQHYSPGILSINTGEHAGETSDFACAEIIVFKDTVLTEQQKLCVEDYLDLKYDLGIFPRGRQYMTHRDMGFGLGANRGNAGILCEQNLNTMVATIENEHDLANMNIPTWGQYIGLQLWDGKWMYDVLQEDGTRKKLEQNAFIQSLWGTGLPINNNDQTCAWINVDKKIYQTKCNAAKNYACDKPTWPSCLKAGRVPESTNHFPNGFDLSVTDIDRTNYGSSEEKCALWCQNEIVNGCQGYSYDKINKKCYPKHVFGYIRWGIIPDLIQPVGEEWVSGSKWCFHPTFTGDAVPMPDSEPNNGVKTVVNDKNNYKPEATGYKNNYKWWTYMFGTFCVLLLLNTIYLYYYIATKDFKKAKGYRKVNAVDSESSEYTSDV